MHAAHLACRSGKGAFLPCEPACSQTAGKATLTLFPGLGDDFSRALAHHLGDVQGAVGLVGNGNRAIHGFGLDLQRST